MILEEEHLEKIELLKKLLQLNTASKVIRECIDRVYEEEKNKLR